ncbi:S-layer homology domain-containing protein [Paenibacillus lutrae]|nr:S-layer homology domain-containing protein [Paenibacillus lutrae]
MKSRKWLSVVMMFAMLISLLPPLTAYAASTISITNMYNKTVNFGTEKEAPEDYNNVTRVTRNPFTLKASISNISESQIPTIYYEITNVNTKQVTIEKSHKPSLTSANEITFTNITLSEGLNRIVIKMGDTNQLSSAPGWIYYTPTTNLTDFTINNENLVDGKIYPVDRNNIRMGVTAVDIKAKASNANQVKAYESGSANAKLGILNRSEGMVYFRGGDAAGSCGSTGEICLKAGDNRIVFDSSNDSNSYQTEKRFVYDNGQPFAFGVEMGKTSAGQTESLLNKPNFDVKELTLKTNLKVDYNRDGTNAPTSLRYNLVDIMVNGNQVAANLDLNTPSSSVGGAVKQFGKGTGLKNEYDVFNLTLDLNVAGVSEWTAIRNPQQVQFIFKDSLGVAGTASSAYTFSYTNPSEAGVTDVAMVTGKDAATNQNIYTSLSELATTEINELPVEMKILTNAHTAKIRVLLDNKQVSEISNPGNNEFIYKLENITDGQKQLKFLPVDAAGIPVENGSREYSIQINNAPYIIANQISSPGNTGITIRGVDQLTCGTTVGCLSGKAVNYLPTGAGNKVELYVNDKMIELQAADFDANRQFKFELTKLAAKYGITAAQLFSEGANQIKFYMYVNNSLISRAVYNVNLITAEAPEVVLFLPKEDTAGKTKFPKAQKPDMYATTERTVQLNGKYFNTNAGNVTVSLNVYSKDKDGNPKNDYHTWSSTTGSSTSVSGGFFTSLPSSGVDFTTNAIALPERGEMTFQFTVTNQANMSVSKTVTIAREPLAYVIKEPVLIENEKHEYQANINSNFTKIVIDAEKADSVVFGKEKADKETLYENGLEVDRFTYEVRDLKAGKNTVKFTVNRGSTKTSGSIVLFNTNTPVAGAQYLDDMGSSFKVFDGGLQLKFDKDTKLKRYKPTFDNKEYITADRKLYFGIADSIDGRVDKFSIHNQFPNDYAKSRLAVKGKSDNFSTASKLYYVDAGVINEKSSAQTPEDYLSYALQGRGIEPYDPKTNFFTRSVDQTVVPTKRGTLTLKFDPSIRDDAGKYISVFFFDTYEQYNTLTGRGWVNLGGTVNTGSNTITVPFEKFGYYQVMYMDKGFDDLTGHPWARNELEMLFSKGIMNSKTNYSFSPNEPISRGEFATMLVRIFDLPLNYGGTPTFIDVFKVENLYGLYDYKYIETAARAGIIRGTAGNRFSPDSSITRQDMAVMIARAADLKLATDANKTLSSLQKTFTDGSAIDYYARPAVEAVFKKKYIEGKPNVLIEGQKKETVRFDPLETFTRAEAAIVASRVMGTK